MLPRQTGGVRLVRWRTSRGSPAIVLGASWLWHYQSNSNVCGVIKGGVLVQVFYDSGTFSFQRWRWWRRWTVLGCEHHRSLVTSISSSKTPLRHLDIDFHDVFGDSPLRFLNQITRWRYGTIRVERKWGWSFNLLSMDWSQWEVGAWRGFNGAAELELSSHSMVRLSWKFCQWCDCLSFLSLVRTFLSFLHRCGCSGNSLNGVAAFSCSKIFSHPLLISPFVFFTLPTLEKPSLLSL